MQQIYSIRVPRGVPRDIQSIIPVSPVFGESSGDPSGSSSDNPTKDLSLVPIANPSIMLN